MSAPSAAPAVSDAVPASGSSAGRRRAQLVASGARSNTSRRHLSQADVHALGAHPAPEARAALAAKFGRDYDNLSLGETRALANQVLELLSRDSDPQVRQALAEALAASPSLPAATAAHLARDEIAVARPILQQSPVLDDDELAEIVRTRPTHAHAIAAREQVSEVLVDTFVAQGDAEVILRLIDNRGAHLSARILRRIAENHRDDREIESGLIRRPDLPFEVIDRLVGALGERLGWDVVRERRMSAEEAHRLLAATRLRTRPGAPAAETVPEPAVRPTQGEIVPEELLAHLRDGEVDRVEAGLAQLTGVDVRKARQLLQRVDKRGLAALCARAGLTTTHYAALRMILDLAEQAAKGDGQDVIYGSDSLRLIQEQYERVLADPDLLAEWLED